MSYTSDGLPRPNIEAAMGVLAVAGIAPTTPIPTSIGLSARVSVLNTLGLAVVAAGGTMTPISQWAAYDNSSMCQNINAISAELNTMGATPPLPIYTSIDYNAFTSIVNNIVTTMDGMT